MSSCPAPFHTRMRSAAARYGCGHDGARTTLPPPYTITETMHVCQQAHACVRAFCLLWVIIIPCVIPAPNDSPCPSNAVFLPLPDHTFTYMCRPTATAITHACSRERHGRREGSDAQGLHSKMTRSSQHSRTCGPSASNTGRHAAGASRSSLQRMGAAST